MKRVVIFASGSGTNAENIIKFFRNSNTASVVQVLTNNPRAKVLERCKILDVSAFSFNRIAFLKTDDVIKHLVGIDPDIIVLAGFIWKIPKSFIEKFPDKIVNIHPALLPRYGGKGMYGKHVHEAIVKNGEIETGITIHHVNENYDEGDIIFQAKCKVDDMDTPEIVASKVHKLEMEHFPRVIEGMLKSQMPNANTQKQQNK